MFGPVFTPNPEAKCLMQSSEAGQIKLHVVNVVVMFGPVFTPKCLQVRSEIKLHVVNVVVMFGPVFALTSMD